MSPPRRRFVKTLLSGAGLAGLGAAPPVTSLPVPAAPPGSEWLPAYARAQAYRSKKQSSHDPTGGNEDYWAIKRGEQRDVFAATGAGVISHIWVTIAAQSPLHLKELVLRGELEADIAVGASPDREWLERELTRAAHPRAA